MAHEKTIQTKYQRYNATAKGRYVNQRRSAKHRRILFRLTFEEWWQLWQDSGKWTEYGRHKGQYCMARSDDRGAYEIGNVRICLVEENHTERHRTHPITGERNGSYGKSFWHHLTPGQRTVRLAAMSARQKGIAKSASVRAKMSLAAKRRWQRAC